MARYFIRFYDSVSSEDWTPGFYYYNRDENMFYLPIGEATAYPSEEAARADFDKAYKSGKDIGKLEVYKK